MYFLTIAAPVESEILIRSKKNDTYMNDFK